MRGGVSPPGMVDVFAGCFGRLQPGLCGGALAAGRARFRLVGDGDWIIDRGPEAGVEGGKLVFEGKPSDLKKIRESNTGKFL